MTKAYLDGRLAEAVSGSRKELADLQAGFSDKLREQTRWLTSTFVVLVLAAVIRQRFWRSSRFRILQRGLTRSPYLFAGTSKDPLPVLRGLPGSALDGCVEPAVQV